VSEKVTQARSEKVLGGGEKALLSKRTSSLDAGRVRGRKKKKLPSRGEF